MTDRDTGMCIALPTQQKGGRSLSYLVTEMCRFIVHCGHTEIGLRCDSEPSTLSLLEAVRKACATLRITAHAEPAPTGLLGQAEQPQDGEQEPIFTDEGMEEAVAAAKRASRAQSMNVDVPQTPVYAETSSQPSGKHNTQHDVTGGDSKRFHATAVEASSGHGDVVPQTPQSEASVEVLDDASFESMQPVNKAAKRDDTGHLGLLGQILKIEQLDIEPDVNLEMDEVDTMIQHELNLNEDPYETMDDVGPNVDELSFPYSPQEPELSAD